MTSDILVSIVTPTYNRCDLLPDCFSSLICQTDPRFEWIIVDDGSTDDTEAVVRRFQADSHPFDIIYVKKENGGKHTALNTSHSSIRGQYVLILDSDDRLTPDAVSECIIQWDNYQNDPSIGVLVFLKGNEKNDPFCYVEQEKTPVDLMTYPRVKIHSYDACEVIRADVFRQFPFPVFRNERFLSEGVLWGRVSFSYRCVYINQVIYLCEYLEGGLTKSGRRLRINTPLGGMFNSNIHMTKKLSLKLRIKYGLLYTCYGFFARFSPRKMAQQCDHKALMYLCLPFGWLLYLFWKWKYLRQPV